MKKTLSLYISVILCQLTFAQTPPGNLEDGLPVRTWIKANYYTNIHTGIGYNEARKKIYGYIENFEDSIECVYSGFKGYNDRGNEVGSITDFNIEHSVPQSYFDDKEPMKGDIHILFPCYEEWNNLRSFYKFAEVDDNQTDQWILGENSSSSIPTSNIDDYSEYRSGISWEPRENRKGDIARAVFYFYTMYTNYSIDGIGIQSVFCDWHKNDLPDDRERTRNERIPTYQGNSNPYINHPDWANRAWGCNLPTSINRNLISESINIYPNPSSELINVNIDKWNSFPLNASIVSLDGKKMYKVMIQQPQTLIDVSELSAAKYVLVLRNIEGNVIGNKRLVVQ